MSKNFIVSGVSKNHFLNGFSLSEKELHERNAEILIADAKPGYPCRVSLEDAEVGERVMVIPFVHHDVQSPYHSSGPIFIRENAKQAKLEPNQIPQFLGKRLLSIRSYNVIGVMIAGEVIEGVKLREYINQMLGEKAVQYLHVHNARQGCFLCYINRI